MTAQAVVEAARAAGLVLATAESCTGGLLAAELTGVAGASAVFDRGFISYSYPSKPEILRVDPAILQAHGAVSAEVVEQMAIGALAHSDADIAIAITGIAGPVAAGTDKPEGLVWFAIASDWGLTTERRAFGALGRAEVRKAAVAHALAMLHKVITLHKN